ncbi:ROK family protein [Thalassotalea maritima]|uniref:ROK family protein n=1 Tax=Thalassotalea maritima TaxID=3242416 RepID=UPI003527BDAF
MYICIDIGGTKISAALVEHGNILAQKKAPSPIHNNIDDLLGVVTELCHEWRDKAEHIAIACTGLVGKDRVNFLSVRASLPVKACLEQTLRLPVTILNDAAAAAWAEYQSIPDSKPETLVYVTVSTGIGAGIIQNGQLVTSNDGFCAHIGHLSVPSKATITCHCGLKNCIETLSSGTAIATRASTILGQQVSAKDVFTRYLAHPAIQQLIAECAHDLVNAFASIKALTGTSMIVLGGSVGMNEYFRRQVSASIDALPKLYQFTLLFPRCGANADLLGAYLYTSMEK